MRCLTPIVVAILAFAPHVHAEEESAKPRSSGGAARTEVANYFLGEVTGGFVLLGLGTAEMVTGTLLLVGSADGAHPGVRGASYPMLGIGLAHALAGLFVNVSSAKRVRVFGNDITRDPQGFVRREQKRMKGVSRQFLTLKIVETVVAAGGITTAIVVHDDHPQIAGAGISLAVGMAATFVFDVVAARRAHRYRRALADIGY